MLNFDLVKPRRVIEFHSLGAASFILAFERRGLAVRAGRHVGVGLPGDETREYSVFSGERDEHLEILVRKVQGGTVSPRLELLRPGDSVQVKPPRGSFTLALRCPGDRLVLIATGTGVAPFRSFLRTEPDLDCIVVHGVRTIDEDLGAEFVSASKRVVCVSQPLFSAQKLRTIDGVPVFPGRVTDWARVATFEIGRDRFYLCGHSGMISEIKELLENLKVPPDRIHTETYF